MGEMKIMFIPTAKVHSSEPCRIQHMVYAGKIIVPSNDAARFVIRRLNK